MADAVALSHDADAASSQTSSYADTASSGGAPSTSGLFADSANVSQTTLDTDITSPSSSDLPVTGKTNDNRDLHVSERHQNSLSSTLPNAGYRLCTPENQTDASSGDASMTSPMSITTPVNGVKRSADREVKDRRPTLLASPPDLARTHNARSESVSSSGSRAGEAAAQLKTRLAYAMAKVQHGWEHRSINEVEQLAAQLSPRAHMLPSPKGHHQHSRTLSNGLMNGADRLSLLQRSPQKGQYGRGRERPVENDALMSPPSKRRSGVYQPVLSPQRSQNTHRAGLGPPAELVKTSSRDTAHHAKTRPLAPVNGNSLTTTPPSTRAYEPATPKSIHRPATIRTQIQTAQAEQDAMDALLLMGSPKRTGHPPNSFASQHSSSQQSPVSLTFGASAPQRALLYRNDSSGSDSVSSHSEQAIAIPRQARADNIEAH